MAAQLITQITYDAWCADCGWGVQGFDDDGDAEGAINTHNHDNHAEATQ